MLSLNDVSELRQRLADSGVLSVYIGVQEHDPAQRAARRLRLDANLAGAARDVNEADAAAFEQARDHLLARIETSSDGLGGRARVGFATARGVDLWSELPATMPDLVRWRRGPLLGPLLRALKHERALLIALVDSRRARLFRYQHGELSEDADFRADWYIDDLTDRRMSKRARRFTGVHGETATDAAHRILGLEAERLLDVVADWIREGDGDAAVVIGGPAAASSALHRRLLARGTDAHVQHGLQMHVSLPELQAVIEPLASVLTQRAQLGIVREVLDRAGASDRAVLGEPGTAVAAQRGQVDLLLLTPRLMVQHEELTEELIAWVLASAGALAVLSAEPAELLDGVGGVGARLRYPLRAASGAGTVS